jgi:hypothetical protein
MNSWGLETVERLIKNFKLLVTEQGEMLCFGIPLDGAVD